MNRQEMLATIWAEAEKETQEVSPKTCYSNEVVALASIADSLKRLADAAEEYVSRH